MLVYTEITSDIVEEIYDASESILTQLSGVTYDFDKENEEQIYTLKDVNGKELSFADIKVGDIINVMVSYDGEDQTGNELYEYIISSDKVEGTVAEENEDGTKVVIGDKEYKVNPDEITVEAGDKGIFYVDIMGNIIYKELDVSSRTFGILYQIKANDDLDESIEVTIYTKEGKFETFTLDDKIDLVLATEEIVVGELTVVDKNILLNDEEEVIDVTTAPMLVMYSANSAGEIKSIVDAESIATVTDDDYVYVSTSEAKYSADDEAIDDMYIVDSSVIVASKEDELVKDLENYAVSSKAVFADDETYAVDYVADSNEDLVFAIVYDATAKVEPTNAVMFVTKTSKGTTEDGDEYSIIRGYVNGEEKSFNVNEDTDVAFADGRDVDDAAEAADFIAKGALVQYNEGDIASAIRIIATADEIEAAADGEELTFGEDYSDEETGYLVAGKVDAYKNNKIKFEDGTELKFTSGTPTVKYVLKDGSIDKFKANYSISNAQTANNSGEGENDDVVIVYSFDKDNFACVVVDVENNNKK